jgi:hypothetical protein
MDDILVWGPSAPNAPITDLMPEGSVDRSIVTQNLVNGTAGPTPDQRRAEQAWSDVNKGFR